jgi:hypothetical protein
MSEIASQFGGKLLAIAVQFGGKLLRNYLQIATQFSHAKSYATNLMMGTVFLFGPGSGFVLALIFT